jgi:hypothetical protein
LGVKPPNRYGPDNYQQYSKGIARCGGGDASDNVERDCENKVCPEFTWEFLPIVGPFDCSRVEVVPAVTSLGRIRIE